MFLYDVVLIVFFLIFMFMYNWVFDSVFGLLDVVMCKVVLVV